MTTELGEVGTVQTGLEGTQSQYVVVQLRSNGSGLRVQGKTHGNSWETDVPVSEELRTWIKGLDHSRTSTAGTSTAYAPALMKVEGDQKVRVQVPGDPSGAPDGGKREFGCVFLLTSTILWNHAKAAK